MKRILRIFRLLWDAVFKPNTAPSPELIALAKEAVRITETIKRFVEHPVFDVITAITPTTLDEQILNVTRKVLREVWEEIVPERKKFPQNSALLAFNPPFKTLQTEYTESQRKELFQNIEKRLLSEYASVRNQTLSHDEIKAVIQYVRLNEDV